jgi:hypothetical protein
MDGLTPVMQFKMPFETKHFNKNQKVWVQRMTGNQAALVEGRFRGKNRYVSAWVNWGSKNNPNIKTFEVSVEFARRHNLKME